MNTTVPFLSRLPRARLFLGLATAALLAALPARAQIFVPNVIVVAKYTATGAILNATLVSIPDLGTPNGLAVSGSNLFVTDGASSAVGLYNAVNGAVLNTALIPGFLDPTTLAVSGGNLYVADDGA